MTDRPSDRAAEAFTVPFESVVTVYLDGFGTGIASTLQQLRPDAPRQAVDEATQAVMRDVIGDPAAVEQIRDLIRRRLAGDTDDEITTIIPWTERGRR
ncbi:hypothetical protein ACWESM_18640 [Nocardia sp. NPDC003999]